MAVGSLPTSVEYAMPVAPNLCVSPLREEQIERVASRVVRLLADAYSAQFEPDFVPPGTFRRTLFRTDDSARIEAQGERMYLHMTEYKSQYWLAHLADDQELIGLAKTTPKDSFSHRMMSSMASYLGIPVFTRGEVYVNDIAVSPRNQHQGIGSRVLHASLAFGHDQASTVALDGFTHNPVNDWYLKLGLRETGSVGAFNVGEDYTLQQRRFETSEGASVGTVVSALELLNPSMQYTIA